jgi:hypothetical protein
MSPVPWATMESDADASSVARIIVERERAGVSCVSGLPASVYRGPEILFINLARGSPDGISLSVQMWPSAAVKKPYDDLKSVLRRLERLLYPVSRTRPLFLLGCPRSGTTLLANILNSHNGIIMTSETAVFLLLSETIRKCRAGVSSGLLFGKQYNSQLADLIERNARKFIHRYYEQIRELQDKRRLAFWGEKHPHHSLCLEFIEDLYPRALYIFITRDPRDAACSIAAMNGWSFRASLDSWIQFSSAYEAFLERLDEGRWLWIRYEDLVGGYEEVTQAILSWLRLELTNEVRSFLSTYRHVDAHHIRAARLTHRDFAVESVGRWRRELDDTDVQYAREAVGRYLEKYGYH